MIKFNEDGTISLVNPCNNPIVVSPEHPHIGKFFKVMQTHDCLFYGTGLYFASPLGCVNWASAIIPFNKEALTALHLQIPLLPIKTLAEYNATRLRALHFIQTPNRLYPYCDIERTTVDTVIGLSNDRMAEILSQYSRSI